MFPLEEILIKSDALHACDSWRSWNVFFVLLRHRSGISNKNMLVCLPFFPSCFFFFFFSRPIRSLPWKGFQQEFRRHPCEQRTAPSASREWRITSNYYIKRMATREKVWAWPSQRDLSVRDQESCCNFL